MNSYWERINRIKQIYIPLGGMLFPPATKQQILATEATLGFLIPQPLKHYFEDIANGGFGPPWGIIGAHEGYQGTVGDIGSALGNLFDWEGDLHEEGLSLHQTIDVFVSHHKFKPLTHLVIVDRGCGEFDEMHFRTGKIYRTNIASSDYISIEFIAESIDDYLDFWLTEADDSYKTIYEQIRSLQE